MQSGLFVNKAPFGYANLRVDGRSIVQVDPIKATKVRRIFDLYANAGHTLDSLQDRLDSEESSYTDAVRRFPRSKLHEILQDRSYIGEVFYQGQWYPGSHPPLIDRSTWDRVQSRLGGKHNESHEMVFASNLIKCGHCGHAVTGELKTKATRAGEKTYAYYRCARYSQPDHPRLRVSEGDLNDQVTPALTADADSRSENSGLVSEGICGLVPAKKLLIAVPALVSYVGSLPCFTSSRSACLTCAYWGKSTSKYLLARIPSCATKWRE